MTRRFLFSTPPGSEITPAHVFAQRRQLIAGGASAWLLASAGRLEAASGAAGTRLGPLTPGLSPSAEKPTAMESVTSYGNFYEFGPDKDSPAKNAHRLQTRPWQLTVDGEVKQAKTFDIDDLLRLAPLEERVYRLRCVEGWSAVIPWAGFPLSELLKRVQPTGNAKYVEFVSLADPAQMPYVRLPVLQWPYTEGLRMDEAMHPLTLLAFGMYGEVMPKQNGAPVRLVVPWKYGFKSAKSLVRIRLVEKQPMTAWVQANPREYGFFSNVNPAVPHPRWNQDTERRLGEFRKRPTLPFNGYGEQVASLYAGMDLKKHF